MIRFLLKASTASVVLYHYYYVICPTCDATGVDLETSLVGCQLLARLDCIISEGKNEDVMICPSVTSDLLWLSASKQEKKKKRINKTMKVVFLLLLLNMSTKSHQALLIIMLFWEICPIDTSFICRQFSTSLWTLYINKRTSLIFVHQWSQKGGDTSQKIVLPFKSHTYPRKTALYLFF